MDAGDDDFLERFQELILFERRGFPEGHPYSAVYAMPKDVALPPIWLLGSSGYSAQLAAMVGMGFSFAHHFSDHDAVAPMIGYREQFKPSRGADRSRTRSSAARWYARIPTPRPSGWPPPSISTGCGARAASICRWPVPRRRCAYPYSPVDRERIRHRRARLFVGAPATVREQLAPLIAATKADELMVTTMIYDHAARRHSYELLAEAFGLKGA